VLAERHQQPVDVDPPPARQHALERRERLLGVAAAT
jgi:hypothetical protein